MSAQPVYHLTAEQRLDFANIMGQMHTFQKETHGLQPASASTIVLFHCIQKLFKTGICLCTQPQEPDSCWEAAMWPGLGTSSTSESTGVKLRYCLDLVKLVSISTLVWTLSEGSAFSGDNFAPIVQQISMGFIVLFCFVFMRRTNHLTM